MARLWHVVAWAAALTAVPATVAFAPVHPPEALRWEPQVVAVGQPVMAPETALGAARPVRRGLPPGVGNERGLQLQTLLAERAISAAFPEITEIGGVRPDSMKWHPNGLAIDVIIPHWDTPAGRVLGDRVVEFTFKHAKEFGLEYVIWQQTYRPAQGTPHRMPDYGSPDANHYTHVHISSYGGGYPKGDETYLLSDET